MELTTEQINKYQKECLERAGCVMCAKSLQEGEVYACEECASMEVAYRDPNGFMAEEYDE